MPGRGRRIAVALIALALVLSAGRWASVFLAERLWETSVSERVAQAGGRLALQALGLELLGLAVAFAWFFAHFTIAARIALPGRRPPERDAGRTWPVQLPRWSLAVLALVLGALLGSGAGSWLHELLLSADGARIGVPDPLLGADLGIFLSRLPLWLDLQHKATLLVVAALGGVLLLHVAGETIRVVDRRLWIFPRARAQLAFLLAMLALTLSWASGLERYRLAAGLHGPLLPSEFQLGTLVARIQTGLAALAALFSFLWWYRMRGLVVLGLWALFGVALLVGRGLPLRGDAAAADPDWAAGARGLDSIAFQLVGLDAGEAPQRAPVGALVPTVWDDTVLALGSADSGRLSDPRRGWLRVTGPAQPVWFAVREQRGQAPALLVLSDDRVSASGGPLAWRKPDTVPVPTLVAFRSFASHEVRPLAGQPALTTQGGGVRLESWIRRIVLAWALQTPGAFSAPRGTRMVWRLDPTMRLRGVAPFVHWTPPRARLTGSGLMWQSDGLLTSSLFPSSARIEWGTGKASMVRSSFLGMVSAADGRVRIFRRDPADSLAAAWARITRPLIEPPDAVPPELRADEAYPQELLRAQAQVLEGASWNAGHLESLPPEAAGGNEYLVPFNKAGTRKVVALLHARRTVAGDSLRLLRLDSLWTVDAASGLGEMWRRFPFRQALEEEVLATGDSLRAGQVRYALTADGIAAYQPAWAVSSTNRARLVLLNVALGRGTGAKQMLLGTGRTLPEAWKNLRGETSPLAGGSGAEALLEQVRKLVLRADSLRKRGALEERERVLSELRDLLEPRRP